MLYLNNLNENSVDNSANSADIKADGNLPRDPETTVNCACDGGEAVKTAANGSFMPAEAAKTTDIGDGEERFAEETPVFSAQGEIFGGVTGCAETGGEISDADNAEGGGNVVKEYFSAPKEKIKKVADIFGETEEDILKEYKAFKAQKLFKKLDFFITDLPFSDENFKNRCLIADEYSMFGVTVFPTAVALAKSVLNGKAAVRAIISYPYGEDVFKVKLKAVKEAVKRGADGIAVVLSVGEIMRGDRNALTKQIKKYVKACKKTPLCVAADCAKLTPLQIENCFNAVKAAGGVRSVAAFSSDADKPVRLDTVKDVVKSVDNSLAVEVMGEIYDLNGAIDYFKSGANKLISEKSEQIAEDVKNKIKTA